MTFNIRFSTAPDGPDAWPLRRELLMRTIEAYRPDLLGMQEVLPDQLEALKQRLKGHAAVAVGRDADGQGEMSALLFRSDRFEKLRDGTFWLSATPDVPGSKGWDAQIPRIVTWAELRDRAAGGRALFVFNTHWDHRGARARAESAKLMRQRIRAIAGDAPVIVTGDFNAPDGCDPHRDLTAAAGEWRLTDAYRALHPQRAADQFTFHAFTGRSDRPRVIDWILHSPHFQARAATIDRTNENGRYPSDHFPVTAELMWTAQAPPATRAR
ncbi:MAG TPA: endonuclease/exonuclease/phosphatase family protein [Tepidisphaeraceae bacterium]|nr:endonuclease/exonuclease/phosphatase family protein [Tepidisphaeraceae bacterium]